MKTKKIISVKILASSLLFVLVAALLKGGPASAAAPPSPSAYDGPYYIQFCKKGLSYGASGCADPHTMMSDAILDAKDAAADGISGTIYVEAGDFSNTTDDETGGLIYIGDFNYGTSLTIQGGVNGGTTTFVRGIKFTNTGAGLEVVMKDLTVSSTAGPTEPGIEFYGHTGDVRLENLHLIQNQQQGLKASSLVGSLEIVDTIAELNTYSNIDLGNVSGDITLSGVQSNDSEQSGIYLNTILGTKGVSLQNVSALRDATWNIYMFYVAGGVSLSQVQADESDTSLGIKIEKVEGKKGVSLKEVSASGNAMNNININNISGDLNMDSVTAAGSVSWKGINVGDVRGKKGVTLSNATVNGNSDDNIQIKNIDSSVSLTDVEASLSSAGMGINLTNIEGTKGVTLTNVTTDENKTGNISISTLGGGLKLTSVSAPNSDGNGIYISNVLKQVALKDTQASNNNTTNIYIGVVDEDVSLSGVTADNSQASGGISIQNIAGKKGVTLSDVNASDNAEDNLGIYDISGDATLKSITCNDSKADAGIYLSSIGGNKGVRMNDITANGNDGANIGIYTTTGNVSLNKVEANDSSGYRGIDIININGAKGVTLKTISASNNSGPNININNTDGSASLVTVDASSSTTGGGIYLNTIRGSKGVMLNGVTADDNGAVGISILSVSEGLKIINVHTSDNHGNEGMQIETVSGKAGAKLIGVTAENNFSQNLSLTSIAGDVMLRNITANASQIGIGVLIVTVQGSKGVSLNSVSAENNSSDNIKIENVSGSASLKAVTANSSLHSQGLRMVNIQGSKGVSLSSVTALANDALNITIETISGDVKLAQVQADNSLNDTGIRILNVQGLKGVSIISSSANGNYGTNINISSVNPGNVVLTSVNVNNSVNSDGGFFTDIAGTLMLISSNFNGNQNRGINTSNIGGLIAIKNVEVKDNIVNNGGQLYSLNNQLVCDSEFSGNGMYGIYASADGYSITLSNVTLLPNGSGDYSSTGTIVKNESTKCKVIPVSTP